MLNEVVNDPKDNMTKRIQITLKSILAKFVEICNENGLRYYLIDGSLLGAVRHKGFIPWDDDIDVGMPRPDYEQFCRIAKSQLPDNMYLVTYEESLKEDSIAEISRIYCKDLRLRWEYFGKSDECNAWIDIMIMDGMPSNAMLRYLYYIRYRVVKAVARMGRIQHIGGKKYSFAERLAISFAKKFKTNHLINSEKWFLKNEKSLKKCDYNKSKYIIVWPSEYGKKEIARKSIYEPGIKRKFEDLQVSIPANPDVILKKLYGDYLKLPSEAERHSKHKVTIMKQRV